MLCGDPNREAVRVTTCNARGQEGLCKRLKEKNEVFTNCDTVCRERKNDYKPFLNPSYRVAMELMVILKHNTTTATKLSINDNLQTAIALWSCCTSRTVMRHRNEQCYKLSRVMRKPTFLFPTWSDTNQAVQQQKMARGLKFRI